MSRLVFTNNIQDDNENYIYITDSTEVNGNNIMILNQLQIFDVLNSSLTKLYNNDLIKNICNLYIDEIEINSNNDLGILGILISDILDIHPLITKQDTVFKQSVNRMRQYFFRTIREVGFKNIYDIKVTDINFIDAFNKEITVKKDNENMKIVLPVDVLSLLNLHIRDFISEKLFYLIYDYSMIGICYHDALKLITVRDYTEYELKNKMLKKEKYEKLHIISTIELLKTKNLISDYDYANHALNYNISTKSGTKKIIEKLHDKGISSTIIDTIMEDYDYDLEIEACTNAFQMIYNQIKSKYPYSILSTKIKEKLYARGFSDSTIRIVIDSNIIENDESTNISILNKEYDKQLRKYKNKVIDENIKKKIMSSLIRKGFSYEQVKALINERNDVND